MFVTHQENGYVDNGGPVRYLNGSALVRPFTMPKRSLVILVLFVLVGALIGGGVLFNVLDSILNAPTRERADVQTNLSREVSYDLPVLSTLMTVDDATIQQAFTDAGYTIYNNTNAEENPNGGLNLIKLPSDVSEIDAAALYARGINNLSASDAALLLKGSWTLTVDRNEYTSMRVRYADFASGSTEAAIQAALVAEGLDTSTLSEAGTDEVGNTYQTGSIDVDGAIYSWRVSAIALSSVYSISGLPDTAVYVGIRMMP